MTLVARRAPAGRPLGPVRVVARFPRRGRLRFEPAARWRSATRSGSCEIRRAGDGPAEELLVLPRTERVSWLARGARATARNLPRPRRPLRRSRPPRSTACARTGPALRPRGSIGPRWRGAPDYSSGGCGPTPGAGRSSCSTRGAPVLRSCSMRRSGRPRRSTLELARRTGCELLLPGDRRPICVGADLAAWPGAHARLALVDGRAGRCGARARLAAARADGSTTSSPSGSGRSSACRSSTRLRCRAGGTRELAPASSGNSRAVRGGRLPRVRARRAKVPGEGRVSSRPAGRAAAAARAATRRRRGWRGGSARSGRSCAW